MARVQIIIRNTSFTVIIKDLTIYQVLTTLTSSLQTYTFVYDRWKKRNVKIKDKQYYGLSPNGKEYTFSINNLKDFMPLLKRSNVDKSQIDIQFDKEYKVSRLRLKPNVNFKPLLFQTDYIKKTSDKKSPTIQLIELDTGKGKTFISMNTVLNYNYVTGVLVLAKYINKWINEVKKYTTVKDDEIYVIQGSDSLVKLMEEKKPKYKFYIFATRTMSNYIDAYEKGEDDIYPIQPFDLVKHLRMGMLLNDETHQEFYAVFKSVLYMNVKKFIGMSATLEHNDRSMEFIYRVLYPMENRVNEMNNFDPYMLTFAYGYYFRNPKAIRNEGPKGYSHVMFEQSLMKRKRDLEQYRDMIVYLINKHYYYRRKEGERVLIFAATVDMCTYLTNHFQTIYPNLDVRRYVEDDPYENLHEPDICTSTVLSSGTAEDVKNLITVLMTISISSIQANKQSSGRLREIPGRNVHFVYIYAKNLMKQRKFHFVRQHQLRRKSKEFVMENYNKTIGAFKGEYNGG